MSGSVADGGRRSHASDLPAAPAVELRRDALAVAKNSASVGYWMPLGGGGGLGHEDVPLSGSAGGGARGSHNGGAGGGNRDERSKFERGTVSTVEAGVVYRVTARRVRMHDGAVTKVFRSVVLPIADGRAFVTAFDADLARVAGPDWRFDRPLGAGESTGTGRQVRNQHSGQVWPVAKWGTGPDVAFGGGSYQGGSGGGPIAEGGYRPEETRLMQVALARMWQADVARRDGRPVRIRGPPDAALRNDEELFVPRISDVVRQLRRDNVPQDRAADLARRLVEFSWRDEAGGTGVIVVPEHRLAELRRHGLLGHAVEHARSFHFHKDPGAGTRDVYDEHAHDEHARWGVDRMAEPSPAAVRRVFERMLEGQVELGLVDDERPYGPYAVFVDGRLVAVYKPDVPVAAAGRDDGGEPAREIGAYELAVLLDWADLVPVTIRWNGTHGPGSAQRWLHMVYEGTEDLGLYRNLDRQRAAVLDYVMGNTDRKPDNYLRYGDRLQLIDHGLAFLPREDLDGLKLRGSEFVLAQQGRPLDPAVLADVAAVDPAQLAGRLRRAGLGDYEVETALARLEEIRTHGTIIGRTWLEQRRAAWSEPEQFPTSGFWAPDSSTLDSGSSAERAAAPSDNDHRPGRTASGTSPPAAEHEDGGGPARISGAGLTSAERAAIVGLLDPALAAERMSPAQVAALFDLPVGEVIDAGCAGMCVVPGLTPRIERAAGVDDLVLYADSRTELVFADAAAVAAVRAGALGRAERQMLGRHELAELRNGRLPADRRLDHDRLAPLPDLSPLRTVAAAETSTGLMRRSGHTGADGWAGAALRALTLRGGAQVGRNSFAAADAAARWASRLLAGAALALVIGSTTAGLWAARPRRTHSRGPRRSRSP